MQFYATVKMQSPAVIHLEKWKQSYISGPWAAVREEWVEEEEEVAGDLLHDVEKPEVPRHVDPEQLMLWTGFLIMNKLRLKKTIFLSPKHRTYLCISPHRWGY